LNPKISGDHVVWEDWRDGRRHVYGKNLVTGQEFAVSSGGAAEQIEPAIDGDLVVWMDNRNGTWDVWGRRLSGGNEFAITNTPDLNEAWPDVAGNLVVWEQNAGGMESSIYATFVPEPGAAGALAPFGLFALRRRRR